jgi:hypothetical protein
MLQAMNFFLEGTHVDNMMQRHLLNDKSGRINECARVKILIWFELLSDYHQLGNDPRQPPWYPTPRLCRSTLGTPPSQLGDGSYLDFVKSPISVEVLEYVCDNSLLVNGDRVVKSEVVVLFHVESMCVCAHEVKSRELSGTQNMGGSAEICPL